jgi:hypothetical protein
LVGASGFEPPTSWSRTRRSSQAEPRPDDTHSSAKTHPKGVFKNSIGRTQSLARRPTWLPRPNGLCCRLVIGSSTDFRRRVRLGRIKRRSSKFKLERINVRNAPAANGGDGTEARTHGRWFSLPSERLPVAWRDSCSPTLPASCRAVCRSQLCLSTNRQSPRLFSVNRAWINALESAPVWCTWWPLTRTWASKSRPVQAAYWCRVCARADCSRKCSWPFSPNCSALCSRTHSSRHPSRRSHTCGSLREVFRYLLCARIPNCTLSRQTKAPPAACLNFISPQR